MNTDNEVSVSLKARMAAILAAYRAGTLIRAPGVTSAQMEALQQHIDAADSLLRAEFGQDNVAPFVQRAMTATPRLPPGDPAAAAISLTSALMSLGAARRHFDQVEHSQADAIPIVNLRLGYDSLIRFTGQMDNTLREHTHAVLESFVNLRGPDSLVADQAEGAEGSA